MYLYVAYTLVNPYTVQTCFNIDLILAFWLEFMQFHFQSKKERYLSIDDLKL